MLLSEKLKKNNLELWDKTHKKHPFVNAIKDGSLTINKFRYYMIQDYKFLIEYCKVIAIAISKSEKLPIMAYWSKLLDETLNSEMKIHEDFCKDFGINDYELFDSEMSYETKAYCNHLLTIA
ncbi:MAG: thiaminase II, partial [Chloroflexota bacterium]|nr:thiaminase II [Chloroflexota bacterium]